MISDIAAPLYTEPTGIIVGWYAPLAIAVNWYLLVVAVLFVGWFRPRSQRGLLAYGIWLVSVALAWRSVPALYRLEFSDLPETRFSSQFHALTTVGPTVLTAVGVTMWSVWLIRAKRAHRHGVPYRDLLSEPLPRRP